MVLKQLSVALMNRPGELSKLSDLLGDEGINVRAIAAATEAETSVVRFVVDNPRKALSVFQSRGYQVTTHEVFAVEAPDHPGGLNAVLKPLKEAGINVLYLYPFIGRFHDNAVIIVGVDRTEDAIAVLQKNYIPVLQKELYSI